MIFSIISAIIGGGITALIFVIRQEGKIKMLEKMLESKVKDFEKIEILIHEIDKKLERVITIIEIKGEQNAKN